MAGKVIKEIVIKVNDNGDLKVSTREVEKLNKAINKTNTASKGAAKGASTLDRNIKGAGSQSSNSAKNFSKMAQGMQGVLVPAYAEVAARVFALTAAYTALMRAADFSVLMRGQEAYAKMTGKHMGSIAKEIQEASGYMIDFSQASQSAALASTAGLTTKQIEEMTKGARAASVALGRDMVDSMDRLTRGIVKAEPEILDELGIIIRLDNVYKKYAESLGKTTTELTEFEKLTARTNAILGQTQTKFGEIAATVPANSFAQLSASVLDLAKTGGALLSDVLAPLATWLAESPALLGLLMAIITKNVLGKALPALKGMGASFASLPEKMNGAMDKLKKKSDQLAKKRAIFKDILGKPKAMEKELRNTLDKLKIKPNSAIAGALAKSITGKEFRDEIKRAVAAAVGGARARTTRTGVPGGMFGQDAGMVNTLNDAFHSFDKSLKETNKSMRGLVGVEFLNWVNNAKDGFLKAGAGALSATQNFMDFNKQVFQTATNSGMLAGLKEVWSMLTNTHGVVKQYSKDIQHEFSKTSKAGQTMSVSMLRAFKILGSGILTATGGMIKAITGVTTVIMSKLIGALNYLTFAIGALSMLGMVGSWLLGLTNHMNAARKASEDLGDALISVSDRIDTATDINFDNMASNLTKAISDSQFASNVAEEISRNLAKAMSKIDMAAVRGDWVGSLLDPFYDFFGSGLEDSLGDALGLAIKSQTDLGFKISSETFGEISGLLNQWHLFGDEAADNILRKIRNSAKLTTADLNALQEELENSDNAEGMVAVLEKLNKSHAEYSKNLAENTANLTALREATIKYEKDRKKFVKDLVKGNEYEELAKDFDSLINLLNTKSLTGNSKILALEEAGVLPNTKSVGTYMSQLTKLRGLEEDLANTRKAQKDDTAIKAQVDSLTKTVAIAGDALFGALTAGKSTEGLLANLFGQDPKSANADAINLAANLDRAALSIERLKEVGSSSLQEQGRLEANILYLQKSQLRNKLRFAKDGELSAEGYASITDQIAILDEKSDRARRNFEKMAEHSHDIKNTVFTLSEKLSKKRLDILGEGFSPDTQAKWALESAVDADASEQISKSFNVLRDSLNETFSEGQQLEQVLDTLKLNFGAGWFDDNKAKKMLKDWLLLFTKEGKILKDRNKSITEELLLIGVRTQHFLDHEDLLGARENMAKLDLSVTEKALQKDKERLKLRELYLVLAKQESDLTKAKFDESMKKWADGMKTIADSFEGAISSVVSNSIMGKEGPDWREALAQGMADSIGNMVGSVAKQATFGNEGLLAKGADFLGVEQGTIDALFPKTEVQILESSIKGVSAAINAQTLILEATRDYTATVASTVNNGSTNTTESAEGLSKLSDSISKVKVEASVDVSLLSNSINSALVPLVGRINDNINTISNKIGGFTPSKGEMDLWKSVNPRIKGETDDQWAKRYEEQLLKYNKKTSDILEKEQGPNSFAVYDHGANTLLEKLDGKLTGTKGQFAEFKTGMSLEEKRRANLNAKRMPSTKEWLKDYDGKGKTTPKSVGAHATNSGFSEKNPYPRRAYHSNVTGENKMFRGVPDKGFTKGWNPAGAPAASDINRYNELMKLKEQGGVTKAAVPITTATESVSIWAKLAPVFEKLNTALLMLMPNDNIMDTKTEMESLSDLPKGMSGALKVQEVDPKVLGKDGVPIPTTSITGDATTNKLSADLRGSMAANLSSQIQNDNLNAKALITNSLSTVGSNMMSSAIGSMFGFANGGVATGGFRAFANGGTVTKPTLGLVGEGRFNEAVVPLPDGKSIPVIGAGGNSGDNNITVNVTVDSNGNAKSDTQSGMDGDQAKQLGYMVSQAVQAELVEQQRHGGLLSSY